MKYFNQFYQQIAVNKLAPWLTTIPEKLSHWQQHQLHGEFSHWQKTLEALPKTQVSNKETSDSVSAGLRSEINDGQFKRLENLLKKFKPWRKGPYHIHGLHVDTEWRSDFKWDRLKAEISDLSERYVLDVGCGSGYHLWRMQGAGAKFVVGIDPTQLFFMQFQAIQHFMQSPQVNLLPIGVDDLPEVACFDTVFAMGVLYHRRSPIDFIYQLKYQLVAGGELVLETLVVDGDENTVLVPGDRYAKMRNVWFLPSVAAMTAWLQRCGFKNIRVANTDITSVEEQRKTQWIDTESLTDFLDPNDNSKTIEGYPAPQRAVFIANK